jgi:hypothetical protein
MNNPPPPHDVATPRGYEKWRRYENEKMRKTGTPASKRQHNLAQWQRPGEMGIREMEKI